MKTIDIPNTDLTVSEFCFGTMQFGNKVTGLAIDELFNAYRDAGGNFLDTAHCYSVWIDGQTDGVSERIIGDYLRRHNSRDQFIIATKGGHPPVANYRRNDNGYLAPYRVMADIDDSLSRLAIDEIDLYWLHRDDPRLPVGEILEMLETERKRGRIRYYGGSNWTSERLAEAKQYATANNMTGFVASQPRWNLAATTEFYKKEKRQNPGILLTANNGDVAWHTETGLPMIPYTSTANGFFARRGEAPKHWCTQEGVARYQRVEKLSQELNASPNQIALAWLRHQAFPVIPILGTSKVENLKDAVGAANVSLSTAQVNWLRDGD
ncbi:aldo/keto reductase [Rubellicoccus peritrichatus]|uniref:Aldo/keto reductase n=1 Tax=Rubellicoccus peritrichatus TaxID=3080537 RepID=A0AAQ3QVE6_9BACT|nr:aldo/keto reductase [Puniceicoccus sp. CR14]WOO40727.1 aldo/keto reductase [Puniceicoccus sp. CR14]